MGFTKKILKSLLPYAAVRFYERRHELRPNDAPLDDKKIAVISAYDVKYITLLHKAINRAGYKTSTRASDAKYVWIHWYENGVADYTKFANKISTIKVWKQQGRKIIFHIHNKKPHESKLPNVSHALMTVLADTADHISIMSTQTKDVLGGIWYYGDDFSKVSQVPHPNYIGAYGEMGRPILSGERLRILFFGLVRPYKGIERLLEATEGLDDVEVSIIGNASDPEYAKQIKTLCAGRGDVTLRLEYIEDSEIPKIFAHHHIVALPYDIESSLNSGAAILALSYARTVVGTNNGTLSDIQNEGLYFGYNYMDEDDHTNQLRKKIMEIRTKYGKDYNELLKLGAELFKLVDNENSIDAVASSISNMITRIH